MVIHPPVSPPVRMRRLSTESYGACSSKNPFATTWLWFWMDENGQWNRYEDELEIERSFLDSSVVGGFDRTSTQEYFLHFTLNEEHMYQENIKYGTTRAIRRRPAYRPMKDTGNLERSNRTSSRSSVRNIQPSLPAHWSQMSPSNDFERVEVFPGCWEYFSVEHRFHRSMSREDVEIIKIERVQNPYMWNEFARRKTIMEARPGRGSLMKDLFHGTLPENVDKICKHNFDFRLCGRNGTQYGQGSYFALEASCSDRFVQRAGNSSSYFMFLASVLVGSYVKGNSEMRRPPPLSPHDPLSNLHDSCVNDEHEPTVFVVFQIDQCYPSYVIEYVDIPQDLGSSGTPYPAPHPAPHPNPYRTLHPTPHRTPYPAPHPTPYRTPYRTPHPTPYRLPHPGTIPPDFWEYRP